MSITNCKILLPYVSNKDGEYENAQEPGAGHENYFWDVGRFLVLPDRSRCLGGEVKASERRQESSKISCFSFFVNYFTFTGLHFANKLSNKQQILELGQDTLTFIQSFCSEFQFKSFSIYFYFLHLQEFKTLTMVVGQTCFLEINI